MKRTLEPADYWKLRAICTDTQRAQDLMLAAQQRQKLFVTSLGLDPTVPNFALDDETLTVTFPDDDPATPRKDV